MTMSFGDRRDLINSRRFDQGLSKFIVQRQHLKESGSTPVANA